MAGNAHTKPGLQRGLVNKEKADSSGIRTLGIGITDSLIQKGWVDLRGRKLNSYTDLAAIASIYRNPKFETLRIFYVKRGKIVAHEGITSRMPAAVTFERLPKLFPPIARRIQRLKADGYYLSHNHPSGNTEPSGGDPGFTRKMAAAVPGFRGHVVIDGDAYGVISEANDGTGNIEVLTGTVPFRKENQSMAHLKPSQEHPLLGRRVNSDRLFAEIVKEMEVT